MRRVFVTAFLISSFALVLFGQAPYQPPYQPPQYPGQYPAQGQQPQYGNQAPPPQYGNQGAPPQDPDQGPPPERNVARISVLNGEVSVRRGDSGEVVAAALNAPMMFEDRLLTASSSRAEIQFDSANMLRVGSNSEVRMANLQWHRYQVQLAVGTVTLRVIRASDAQMEVDTPLLAIHPLGVGVYRITVREDGSSEVTVREGAADVSTRRGSERVQAGNTLMARGSADDPEFQVVAAAGVDDWDRWCEGRDRELEHSRSRQYVGQDVYGAEDLDRYGRWVNDPSYGAVWAPTVAPGWAPYRAGRWVWEDYYGWTWVSYDPWGWAPYHYGRWFGGPYGWCWYPGSPYGRHYWSPALVGFFGFGGGGIGVGFGFGNVGWVPLAPYERFHPWWGRGYGGRTIVNNTVIVNGNLAGAYRNARVVNGVTAVGASNFGRSSQFMAVNGANIRDAGMVRGALPVSPDRSSLRFADRQVNARAFPQSRNQSFVSRGAQPSAGRGGWQSAQPSSNAYTRGASPQYQGNSSGSWNRFNGTYQSRPQVQAAPSNGGGNGWAGRGGYQPQSSASYNSGRSSAGSYNGGQAVRISPSIVHERSSAPSYSRSSGGSSGGSSHSSSSGHSHR